MGLSGSSFLTGAMGARLTRSAPHLDKAIAPRAIVLAQGPIDPLFVFRPARGAGPRDQPCPFFTWPIAAHGLGLIYKVLRPTLRRRLIEEPGADDASSLRSDAVPQVSPSPQSWPA